MFKKLLFSVLMIISSSTWANGRYFPSWECDYPYRFYFGLEGGYRKIFNISEFNYGFLGPVFVFPINSDPFFVAKDEPDGGYISPQAGIRIPLDCSCSRLIPDAIYADAYGDFFSTEERSDIRVLDPSLTFVFAAPIVSRQFGAADIIATYSRRYRLGTGRIDVGPSYILNIACYPVNIQPVISYANTYFGQTYDINFLVPPGGNLRVNWYQKMTTHYDDLGGGLALSLPIWKCLDVFTRNIFYASWAETKLRSRFFESQAPFTSPISQPSIRNTSWAFRGTYGLGYHYSRFTLGLVANYEYRHFAPKVINAVRTQVQPQLLKGSHITIFSAGAYGGVNF